ncbi:MAG: glycosyltransferase [Gemmatimonadaceae bacterium]
MMSVAAPLLWTLPFVVPPIVVLLRARRSRSIEEFSPDVFADAPLVSVVIPARNERRNIERCVRSVLSADYPRLEVIMVDDHSTDGTGDAARAIAASDARLRVVEAPPLAEGWFGKQWACAAGVRESRGDVLLFTDADTRHEHDLLPRAVNALTSGNVDLVTLAGHQEMHSFWERVVQPHVFVLLSVRYGGTEHVSRATRPADVIANGQFILLTRAAYERVGGHAAVRDVVAEDLALAQAVVRTKGRMLMLFARRHFSTHMYASLAELVRGWRKNMYAGGRNAALGGALGRALFPAILLSTPLIALAPPIVLVLALTGVLSTAWVLWSASVVAAALAFWVAVYRFVGEPAWYAFTYPLGDAMLFYIAAGSVARGNRVQWKDREYVSR